MTKLELKRLFKKMDNIADSVIKYYKECDMQIDKGAIARHNPEFFIWAIRETGSEYMPLDYDIYLYKDKSKAETWSYKEINGYARMKADRIFGVLNNTHFFEVEDGVITQITKEQAERKVNLFISHLQSQARMIGIPINPNLW